MGFFDSLFGIDMDCNGKLDVLDDLIFISEMECEEREQEREEREWLDLDEAEDMEEDWL